MDFFSEVRRYLSVNHSVVLDALVQHIWLALVPVVIAFVLSLPIGWAVVRFGWLRTPLLTVSSIVYTIPSLAMLFLMPLVLGTSILDPLNVVIALALYSLALLVRTTSDALASIDDGVVQAATAMGYKPTRRWFSVELPLAMPVVLAGLRVATVANVSLVSVAALVGIGTPDDVLTSTISYDTAPVNAHEAEARRAGRFEPRGHTAGRLDVAAMVEAGRRAASAEYPHTLDLRRVPGS